MPRKKSIRRFEPRFGVNRMMIETEAQYVAREAEEYSVLSLTELSNMLAERRKAWKRSDETLRGMLERIPERERLIVQCLLFRDVYHMLELYIEHARALPQAVQPAAAVIDAGEPTPFSEWLFPVA